MVDTDILVAGQADQLDTDSGTVDKRIVVCVVTIVLEPGCPPGIWTVDPDQGAVV